MLILVALAPPLPMDDAIDDDSDNDNKPDDDENNADDDSGGGVYNENSCDVACDRLGAPAAAAADADAAAPVNRAGLFIK